MIILQTKEGAHIAQFTSAQVDQMQTPPDIMVWGSIYAKYFETNGGGDYVYREAVMYELISGITCEDA